jgi:AcrR family transcriptional regulator
MSEINKTKPHPVSPRLQAKPSSSSVRERVLKAAFTLFREQGFSSTSMLDIVTRARISKRDLYALFSNKHAVLAACISEHTEQMRRPLDLATPEPRSREALTKLLVDFGTAILKTICHPNALTVFRLAIAESDRAPEVARTLDSYGWDANQKALSERIKSAQALGLIIAGEPAMLADRFVAVLRGDLLIRLLMRVRAAPSAREIAARAQAAADILLW